MSYLLPGRHNKDLAACRFQHAELIHSRYAMAAVAGILIPEVGRIQCKPVHIHSALLYQCEQPTRWTLLTHLSSGNTWFPRTHDCVAVADTLQPVRPMHACRPMRCQHFRAQPFRSEHTITLQEKVIIMTDQHISICLCTVVTAATICGSVVYLFRC